MKKVLLLILLTMSLTILSTGCGATPAAAPIPTASSTAAATETPLPLNTATPDPCGPGQIQAEVQKVQRHMREFDDASTLASRTPRSQISSSIADLQRIRREAEDEVVPPCLTNLQKYQVDHMNSVINTLVAFMGGADEKSLESGLNTARQLHDQYLLELARLLGLTVVPATAPSGPSETPTP
jgi:hypothetical protein